MEARPVHQALLRGLLAAAVFLAILAPAPAEAHNERTGGYRKFPWRAGAVRTLTTLPGECPHCPDKQSSSAWRAIDVGDMDYEKVYAISPGVVDVANAGGGAAGMYLRIKDNDGSYVTYEHLSKFIVTSGRVVAGEPIAVSGCSGNCSGAHLHFQRHDAPSFNSNALDLTPISGHGESGDALRSVGYTGDNAGIGYASNGNISGTMQTAYKDFGGYAFGVTADLGDAWSPCREDNVEGTWWRYSCAPRDGIAGSVQTFKGPNERYRAIMHPTGDDRSYVVYRGILGAYTDTYAGHDWVYWIGYPIENRTWVNDRFRQRFQRGKIEYFPNSCLTLLYIGSELKDDAGYCDE
jgi:hypothetical protein